MWQGPEHSSARLERFLQMTDEHPYKVPEVDESKWFTGGHLGGQIQKINWQVGLPISGSHHRSERHALTPWTQH